ncbi:DedA family protein, partial [Candidatus Gottesmanbacteria bacterium]|nr:DedA family protein [Candidatus Gottesmanbacteria bacterium]
IIFMETGFVVTPFLPGDSLLFAAGTLSSSGALNVGALFIILTIAAILGDTVNYWIGHHLGVKVFKKENARFFKMEYLEKTRQFYAKHGGKTIILARFVPIVRTFAPFVAGVGKMHYGQFLTYNVVGGMLWVLLFTFGGYFFGNLPFIQENFHYAIVVIILVSVLPMVFEYFKHKREKALHLAPKEEYVKIEKTFEREHLAD